MNCCVPAGAIALVFGLTLIELSVSVVAVPVSVTVCGELPALSLKVRTPVRVPATVGVNVTVARQLAPAARVLGLIGQLVV